MPTFDTRKSKSITILHNLRNAFTMTIAVTDQDNVAVDLSTKDLVFSIRETENGTSIDTCTTAAGEITVSGNDNNILTFNKELELTRRIYYHDLQNITDDQSIIDGKFIANWTGY